MVHAIFASESQGAANISVLDALENLQQQQQQSAAIACWRLVLRRRLAVRVPQVSPVSVVSVCILFVLWSQYSSPFLGGMYSASVFGVCFPVLSVSVLSVSVLSVSVPSLSPCVSNALVGRG